MSTIDDLDANDAIDILLSWRFLVATAIGIGPGVGLFILTGEAPAAAALAVLLSVAGILWGVIWQIQHERSQEV